MKTYVLMVSKFFPETHKRKGELTYFPEKILLAIGKIDQSKFIEEFGELLLKIHTIRANYELWERRIKNVQEGRAILSIRYWSGKPYNSKQVEICQLDKDSGVGVQKLEYLEDAPVCAWNINCGHIYKGISSSDLSKNDGLSLDDFKEWFKKYDLSKPMAIIHFTKFRY